MGILTGGTESHKPRFYAHNISIYRVFRTTESHGNNKNYGKSVLIEEKYTKLNNKTSKNQNLQFFKWPILSDTLPYKLKNGWDFKSSFYIGDDIQ